VLLFFPLKATYKQGQEEKTYQAEPRHFARLKEVAGQYAGRADFVAISSRAEDRFTDVTALWQQANLSFPLLRDPQQQLATALSVGIAPAPPHIFIRAIDRQQPA
jgi:peroxiredoxin